MRSGVVIQARKGSSRLPGKVLADVAGKPLLERVVLRCRRMGSIDLVCCAIPDTSSDDEVAAVACNAGATVYRGPESDVLERYYLAALHLQLDEIVRVTSDCPLIDPNICDAVVLLRRDAGADYACNNMPPSWPHGLDCEVFTMDALSEARNNASQSEDREHVTLWLRRSPDTIRMSLPGPGQEMARLRWTVDWPEDLEFCRKVYVGLGRAADHAGMSEVLALLSAHPEIATVNASRLDVARLKR